MTSDFLHGVPRSGKRAEGVVRASGLRAKGSVLI